MHHALPTVKAHGSFNAMFNVANHSTTIATRDVCSATARSPATTELTTLRASGAAADPSPLPRASAGWRSLGIRDPGADGASEKPGRDGGAAWGTRTAPAPLAAVPCALKAGARTAVAAAAAIAIARVAAVWWARRSARRKPPPARGRTAVGDGDDGDEGVVLKVVVSETTTTTTTSAAATPATTPAATPTSAADAPAGSTVSDLQRELRILKGDKAELDLFSFRQLMALSEKQATYTKRVQDELIKRARQMSPTATPTASPGPSPSSRPVSSAGSASPAGRAPAAAPAADGDLGGGAAARRKLA